jgi:DNA-binding transcriptional LysR family regulator
MIVLRHLDYFLTCRERHPREPDIEAFRDWLLDNLSSVSAR